MESSMKSKSILKFILNPILRLVPASIPGFPMPPASIPGSHTVPVPSSDSSGATPDALLQNHRTARRAASVLPALGLILVCVLCSPILSVHAKDAVIVLDPGHGGPNATSDNLGAQYPPYSEKSLTLDLARRIQAELSAYEGITVYLTRTDDTSMTLAERAAFASAVNADLLVSLHYNATGSHLYYGSEVWTSAFGEEYAAGASFGQTALSQLQALGLYSRGVKTRIGSHGDYYGVIRESVSRGVPAVIIEHCYLDNEIDRTQLSHGTSALALADATAIAQYFQLRARDGSADYSTYVRPSVSAAPASGIAQDTTPPELCRLELIAKDGDGNVTCRLTARDSDTIYPVRYYSYTINGVATALLPYDQSAGSVTFTVRVPVGQTSTITATAVNAYELAAASNAVSVAY